MKIETYPKVRKIIKDIQKCYGLSDRKKNIAINEIRKMIKTYKITYDDTKLFDLNHRDFLYKYININADSISVLFIYRQTLQGLDFWNNISDKINEYENRDIS